MVNNNDICDGKSMELGSDEELDVSKNVPVVDASHKTEFSEAGQNDN